MAIRVERNEFNHQDGFQYYIFFKQDLNSAEDDVHARVAIEAAVSVSENGDLADLSFEVPKKFRNDQAMAFLHSQEVINYVAPRVFLALPGHSGDAVINALASLDLDLAGRIVGMEIHWKPASA